MLLVSAPGTTPMQRLSDNGAHVELVLEIPSRLGRFSATLGCSAHAEGSSLRPCRRPVAVQTLRASAVEAAA